MKWLLKILCRLFSGKNRPHDYTNDRRICARATARSGEVVVID